MADQDPSEDDAAQVFEALRQSVEATRREIGGELSVIRKGLEAAFERFDALQPPLDYGQDIGELKQELSSLIKHVAALSQLPQLRQSAEHQAAVLERTTAGALKPTVDRIESQTAGLTRVAGALTQHLDQANERSWRRKWFFRVAGTALVIGMILGLTIPRLLPFGVGAYAAGYILGGTPWEVGSKLMRYESPEGASHMFSADRLVRENAEAIAHCRKTAADTRREQRCSIAVRN